ncbi:hypothetical protein [Myxococcus llanfairpwllgwyngyllgogerychwyrndrobwllllantysiliogogogochensis]|uniref:hypothetical protein n=1 Tax=Myxococcus llanfairpwllgwyngyllgogerychwyrndrobwllllantysiliogogogochensis TaxID=2590453 RepID=UPI001FEA6D3D|nr:hypothetical protein [Myxococcus llanfairpwllgwyngyllgogerychwyrndrobwllllantysiliogogogochensis]
MSLAGHEDGALVQQRLDVQARAPPGEADVQVDLRRRQVASATSEAMPTTERRAFGSASAILAAIRGPQVT